MSISWSVTRNTVRLAKPSSRIRRTSISASTLLQPESVSQWPISVLISTRRLCLPLWSQQTFVQHLYRIAFYPWLQSQRTEIKILLCVPERNFKHILIDRQNETWTAKKSYCACVQWSSFERCRGGVFRQYQELVWTTGRLRWRGRKGAGYGKLLVLEFNCSWMFVNYWWWYH